MSKAIRSLIADVAAIACQLTRERFASTLHPVMHWGWR